MCFFFIYPNKNLYQAPSTIGCKFALTVTKIKLPTFFREYNPYKNSTNNEKGVGDNYWNDCWNKEWITSESVTKIQITRCVQDESQTTLLSLRWAEQFNQQPRRPQPRIHNLCLNFSAWKKAEYKTHSLHRRKHNTKHNFSTYCDVGQK